MPRQRSTDTHLPPGITKTPSDKYQARFLLANGTKKSKTFTNLREAQVWKAERERDVRRGEYVDPQAGKQHFAELWDEFTRSRIHLGASTRARDESYGRSLLLPQLGRAAIVRIDETALQDFVIALQSKGKARSTIEKALQLALASLQFAADRGRLVRVPRRSKINLPDSDSGQQRRFLTFAEVGQLIEATHGHYQSIIITAAFTGLRWGELAGLRGRDINLGDHTLTVNRALKEVKGQITFGEPKWGSRRTIDLSDELVAVLNESPVIGDRLVFTSREGAPLRASNFRRRFFRPAVLASVGEPMRFHDLRHTHAALLIAENVNPKVIQERLGHKDISTTLNVYGHLLPGLGRDAADRLNDGLVGIRRHFVGTSGESNVVELA